jgi:hypothetical protein
LRVWCCIFFYFVIDYFLLLYEMNIFDIIYEFIDSLMNGVLTVESLNRILRK